jgi:hypothetical protein
MASGRFRKKQPLLAALTQCSVTSLTHLPITALTHRLTRILIVPLRL